MAAFTEKAIKQTFIRLLGERPLDKITVKDIIDACGVNRSTFYYYFQDIYDLLNSIFESETQAIVESHIEYESWGDGIKEAMKFVLENRKAVLHIYRSVNKEELLKYLSTMADSFVMDAVRTQAKDMQVDEDSIRLIADVYKSGFLGLVTKWLEEGVQSEPMEIVDKIVFLLDGNMKRMLERSMEYKK